MRVFQFMDQGSGISQLKTVQHFASLQHGTRPSSPQLLSLSNL